MKQSSTLIIPFPFAPQAAVGQLLYDKELGCLRHPPWELAEEFVHAIHDVFETNNSLVAYPPALARVLHPFQWRRHMRGWRTCFRIGTHAAQYCSYRKDVNAKIVQLEPSYAIFGKSNVLWLHGDCKSHWRGWKKGGKIFFLNQIFSLVFLLSSSSIKHAYT